MNRLFLAAAIVACAFQSVSFAAVSKVFYSAPITSTSGGLTVTVNAAAKTGTRIVVYSMMGRSDLSTSLIQVQRADATGVTSNYTTKARYGVGAATTVYQGDIAPIYVGDVGYAYRFLLDSTTANSMVITYGYE